MGVLGCLKWVFWGVVKQMLHHSIIEDEVIPPMRLVRCTCRVASRLTPGILPQAILACPFWVVFLLRGRANSRIFVWWFGLLIERSTAEQTAEQTAVCALAQISELTLNLSRS